ncbi:MAG: CBS domain-containing protein [Bacteroidetes bacterium]|nr:CBS domain-containing protein [Bacteroidota bacterium]
MIAKELISNDIAPLHTSDTALQALSWMEEYRVSHLPIVNNIDFLGLISEEDIYKISDFEEPVGNHLLSISKQYVFGNQHLYDVIKTISSQHLTLLPVLNESRQYLGVITISDLVTSISEMAAIENPGGIIVLELNQNDYSLSEITQIIESNEAKILSLYITSHPDTTKIELTIKVNKMDIRPIIQTFNRYDYTIKASFAEAEYYDDLLDRYNSLMNYLNI